MYEAVEINALYWWYKCTVHTWTNGRRSSVAWWFCSRAHMCILCTVPSEIVWRTCLRWVASTKRRNGNTVTSDCQQTLYKLLADSVCRDSGRETSNSLTSSPTAVRNRRICTVYLSIVCRVKILRIKYGGRLGPANFKIVSRKGLKMRRHSSLPLVGYELRATASVTASEDTTETLLSWCQNIDFSNNWVDVQVRWRGITARRWPTLLRRQLISIN